MNDDAKKPKPRKWSAAQRKKWNATWKAKRSAKGATPSKQKQKRPQDAVLLLRRAIAADTIDPRRLTKTQLYMQLALTVLEEGG